jgi:hypothetical protein
MEFRFHVLGRVKFAISVRLGSESPCVEFTGFPNRCTASGTRHRFYLLAGEILTLHRTLRRLAARACLSHLISALSGSNARVEGLTSSVAARRRAHQELVHRTGAGSPFPDVFLREVRAAVNRGYPDHPTDTTACGS